MIEEPYEFAWFKCPFDDDLRVCGLRDTDVALLKLSEASVSILDVSPELDRPAISFFSLLPPGAPPQDDDGDDDQASIIAITGSSSSSSSSITITGSSSSSSRQLQKHAEAAIKAWAATTEQGATLVAPRLVAKDAPWRLGRSPWPCYQLYQLYDAVLQYCKKWYPGLYSIVRKYGITSSFHFDRVLEMVMGGSTYTYFQLDAGSVAGHRHLVGPGHHAPGPAGLRGRGGGCMGWRGGPRGRRRHLALHAVPRPG